MSQAPVEYQRFHRGESCTEEGCRARKFYIEDGKKFCQRGHEQAGFTQTQQDEDDFNNQGKKKRKPRAEEEKIITVLSGKEAKGLYLQCLQLILWKQCHWLVKVKGFPAELETVVRDLWSLRMGVVWKETGENSQSGYSSQMYSSQSEGVSSGSDATDGKSVSSRRSKAGEERMPSLRETLGLCYLGMLLMRLPVSMGEMCKWVARDEIVFMRALKEIPREMRRKLPPWYHSALELKAPLEGYTLHRTVGDLILFFHSQFQMEPPPLNMALLLYKHVRNLGLPVEIYPSVQRLASLLLIDFSFPVVHVMYSKASTTSYPEIQLIALIVIATKLHHPFDNISRVPESDADPSVTRINWKEWKRIMVEPPTWDLRRGEEILVKEDDIWDMNEAQINTYLDWYQRTWVDDKAPKLAEQILDMFPLDNLPPQPPIPPDDNATTYKLKAVQQTLLVAKSWPMAGNGARERTTRPGELYKRYRHVTELPEFAREFYELAAETVGIDVKILVRAVFRLEARLEKWRLEERRRSVFAAEEEGGSSDEEEEDDEDDN